MAMTFEYKLLRADGSLQELASRLKVSVDAILLPPGFADVSPKPGTILTIPIPDLAQSLPPNTDLATVRWEKVNAEHLGGTLGEVLDAAAKDDAIHLAFPSDATLAKYVWSYYDNAALRASVLGDAEADLKDPRTAALSVGMPICMPVHVARTRVMALVPTYDSVIIPTVDLTPSAFGALQTKLSAIESTIARLGLLRAQLLTIQSIATAGVADLTRLRQLALDDKKDLEQAYADGSAYAKARTGLTSPSVPYDPARQKFIDAVSKTIDAASSKMLTRPACVIDRNANKVVAGCEADTLFGQTLDHLIDQIKDAKTVDLAQKVLPDYGNVAWPSAVHRAGTTLLDRLCLLTAQAAAWIGESKDTGADIISETLYAIVHKQQPADATSLLTFAATIPLDSQTTYDTTCALAVDGVVIKLSITLGIASAAEKQDETQLAPLLKNAWDAMHSVIGEALADVGFPGKELTDFQSFLKAREGVSNTGSPGDDGNEGADASTSGVVGTTHTLAGYGARGLISNAQAEADAERRILALTHPADELDHVIASSRVFERTFGSFFRVGELAFAISSLAGKWHGLEGAKGPAELAKSIADALSASANLTTTGWDLVKALSHYQTFRVFKTFAAENYKTIFAKVGRVSLVLGITLEAYSLAQSVHGTDGKTDVYGAISHGLILGGYVCLLIGGIAGASPLFIVIGTAAVIGGNGVSLIPAIKSFLRSEIQKSCDEVSAKFETGVYKNFEINVSEMKGACAAASWGTGGGFNLNAAY